MGFSATVSYLLPTILARELLPDEVIAKCREAIAYRNNIIHQGQREVSRTVVIDAVTYARKFCEILDRLSAPDAA